MNKQPTLWEGERMTMDQALELTAKSLEAFASAYDHWAVAFSGGKDSSCGVTVVDHLLSTGRVKRPKSLTVLYADTRMELPPLQAVAMQMLAKLEEKGVKTQVVLPPMDDRFFVYMFGRGVPPPSNTFRWCTSQLKIEPMLAALSGLRDSAGQKLMMLTGVRLGESAVRDARIALSCGRNGAECGQGWFQEATPDAIADTLAPLLHWRVCHVWDWLTVFAPGDGFPTALVAESYGGDEAKEASVRTGCVGCNLASRDVALETILDNPKWERLRPLLELRPMYAELKKQTMRLRKDGTEKTKDGALVANPCRMGPLTFDARRWGLARILDIQARAGVDLINDEERARIVELIDAGTWPRGWDGTEPLASIPFDNVNRDGSVQPVMMALLGSANAPAERPAPGGM
jgi:DNA sulfur modification protein DndC